MNYLEIFNEAWASAGFQNKLETVRGLKGEPQRLHYFINQQYSLLQGHRDWTFKTVIETKSITQLDPTLSGVGVQFWKKILYNDAELTYYPEDVCVGMVQPTGTPSCFTYSPLTQNVTFNPLDGDYNVEVVYKKSTETLTENTQVPEWPLDFHRLIVFAGAAAFGSYLGDTSIEERCLIQKDEMIGQMYRLFVRPMSMKSRRPFFV